jgi:hypothetical protein
VYYFGSYYQAGATNLQYQNIAGNETGSSRKVYEELDIGDINMVCY